MGVAREEAHRTTSRPRAPRARFPLGIKLFLLTALLIVGVVVIATAITIQRANTIADTTVNKTIAAASRLFTDLQANRYALTAVSVFSLASDVPFRTYIDSSLQPLVSGQLADGTSASGADITEASLSLADQLEQRRQTLGVDLIILLDSEGYVLGRTDVPPSATGIAVKKEDMYESQPIVQQSIDGTNEKPVDGIMANGGKLYHASAGPIRQGQGSAILGYLVCALLIDDEFANQIARATDTAVLFTTTSGVAARSDGAPNLDSVKGTPAVVSLTSAKAPAPLKVELDRMNYVATSSALKNPKATAGAAIFFRSLDKELAPFQEIERTLLFAGAVALLVALISSWLLAKRLTRPIENLAAAAAAVTEGDLTVHPPQVQSSDEVGILADSFGRMLTALRDKEELEQLYEQMAREREETKGQRRIEPVKLNVGTVLVTDLRGLPSDVDSQTAPALVGLIGDIMRLQEREVRRQDGSVLEVIGHRMISAFSGERGVLQALRASRAISEDLGNVPASTPLSVSSGIASGPYVSGSVELKDDAGLTLIGNAPTRALLFAGEAPNGVAFVDWDNAQTSGPEMIASAAKEEVKVRWQATPMQVAAVPLSSLTTGVMKAVGEGEMPTARIGTDSDTLRNTFPSAFGKDLQPGQQFASRYKIEQVLGRGGMGVVYRALDEQLDEQVAIKTLPGDAMTRAPEELERFKREIRIARKITHRNVLRTFDYGEAEGVYFISMEYVRGYTLGDLLERNPVMAPRPALGVARQVSRGLQVAHEQDIIHRDIKPANVLIDHRGEAKLMDFGIAKMAEAEAMTQAGLVVGTPHYMSPEQVQGKPLDPRSDVYAMGVMLYEMLCGKRPFDSNSLTAVLTAHITDRPRPPLELRPELGASLNAIILKCLAKNPADRYRDAGELLAALDNLDTGSTGVFAA